MKKLLFMGLILMSAGAFASNEKTEVKKSEKKVTEKKVKKGEGLECCTATLTYNGKYVDSATFCGAPTQGGNCQMAQMIVLNKNRGTGLD